jgi:hypothetical protein
VRIAAAVCKSQYSIKLHQAGAELSDGKLYQVGREFPLPFALVPWRHHVEIINKCETVEKGTKASQAADEQKIVHIIIS